MCNSAPGSRRNLNVLFTTSTVSGQEQMQPSCLALESAHLCLKRGSNFVLARPAAFCMAPLVPVLVQVTLCELEGGNAA